MKTANSSYLKKNTLPLIACLTFGLLLALHPSLATNLNSPEFAPLGNRTIPQLVGRVIWGILTLSGIIATAMFVYGGVLWMISQGNKDSVQKAQNILVWSVLGMLLIFISYAIVNAIFSVIG